MARLFLIIAVVCFAGCLQSDNSKAPSSGTVEVNDYTDYDTEPGKLTIKIAFQGVAYLEVFAMHGDQESTGAEETDSFVGFYSCESMSALRKKYPGKTIGIIIEN
jgi:hypothetical protein